PVCEVLHREEPAFLTYATHHLLCDVALVEAIVRCIDRLLARLALLQCLLLGVDELAPRHCEVLLSEDLAGFRRWMRRAGMWEQHGGGVFPLHDGVAIMLDGVGQ